jgi:hypothetical protein
MTRALQILLATVGTAIVADKAAANDPHHWHGQNMEVVLRHGERTLDLGVGDNKLDEPKTIRCRSSAGCLISFAANVLVESDSPVYVCSFVDDHQASPACGVGVAIIGFLPSRQSALVPQGDHVIRTTINSCCGGGFVVNWEVDYMIFQKRAAPKLGHRAPAN